MFKKQISLKMQIFLLSSLFIFLGATVGSFADICPEHRKKLESGELQRQVYGFEDLQFNRISNLEFCVTNTGMSFYDQRRNRGSGIWPRGSMNFYIFGGGIWVGSNKRNYQRDEKGDTIWIEEIVTKPKWDRDNPRLNPAGDTMEFPIIYVVDTIRTRLIDSAIQSKIMSYTYNPKYATTTMVPGRVMKHGGTTDVVDRTDSRRYRIFFSQDYSPSDGTPFLEESGPIWPIWDVSDDDNDVLKYDRYFGFYVYDENRRNKDTYPRGPAFISGEDIFTTYKDTDLAAYRDYGSPEWLRRKGYPQAIQYEQMIYSWGFGDYRDFIFIKYDQINANTDTLWDVWLAPVYDVDIAIITNLRNGATNDITCFYGMEPYPGRNTSDPGVYPDPAKTARNMAYQYSLGTMGETGRGFGYCGFVFLESPAVITHGVDVVEYHKNGGPLVRDTIFYDISDSINFIRKDKRTIIDEITGREKVVSWYPVPEQLGLRTFRNWANGFDPDSDELKYEFISRNWRDGPSAPADMRYMMATGPFHMRPGDTARTVVGLVIASTGKGGDADGTEEDLAELVRKVDFMQKVYDENFRAPQPPERTVIKSWTSLNNGMMIQWDSTAEMSVDNYERGLNFMGYTIYRARRTNLDTFDVNNIAGSSMYPSGKGPFGWKALKTYTMPTPFVKSVQPEYGPRLVDAHLGPRSQRFMGIDSMMVVGPVFERDTITGRDTMNQNKIIVMRIGEGVNMYHPILLDRVLNLVTNPPMRPLTKLTEAGFYTDTAFGRYGRRVNAVINSIDTGSISGPWAKFYSKQAIKDGIDFSKTAKFYRPTQPKTFLVDSVMLCTLELNPALAIINPLFYYNLNIEIPQRLADSLLIPLDSNGNYDPINGQPLKRNDVWIVRTHIDSIWDPRPPGKWDTVIVESRIKVDTLYHLGSIQRTRFANGNWGWTADITIRIPDSTQWLRTLDQYNMAMDSIYSYVSKGFVREYVSANFTPGTMFKTDFSGSQIAKDSVIVPYMGLITNNRTFVDIGDDNEPNMTRGDGWINESDDITKTERLFNNVEYFYKVIAFDEGDFGQPTPAKNNEGLPGLPNLATTFPGADRAGGRLSFDVIHQDSGGELGGLFNFNLSAIDEQRAAQLFAGDTIEVEFSPATFATMVRISSRNPDGGPLLNVDYPVGFYNTHIKMTNLTKDSIVLFDGQTQFEMTPCQWAAITTWVDNSVYRVMTDTVIVEARIIGVDSSNIIGWDSTRPIIENGNIIGYHPIFAPRYEVNTLGSDTSTFQFPVANVRFTTGNFQTRNFCYTVPVGRATQQQEMYGTLELSFHAALKQYGGVYRGHTAEKMNPNVTTDVRALPLAPDWINPTTNNNRIPQIGAAVANEVVREWFDDTHTDGSPVVVPVGNNMSMLSPMNSHSTQYARFDNGPGDYEVEFLPGGEETLYLWRSNQQNVAPKRYRVRYLNVAVRDTYSYNRLAIDRRDVDSVEVRYPSRIDFMELPVQPNVLSVLRNNFTYRTMLTPSPLMLPLQDKDPNDFYRKFNLYAQGYIEGRTASNQHLGDRLAIDSANNKNNGGEVHFVGTQGKYYLSATSEDGSERIDFVHIMNVAGAQFAVAYLQRGRMSNGTGVGNAARREIYAEDLAETPTNLHVYGADFQAGDKIRLRSFGGVSGFPEKGAKVRFAVSNPQTVMNNDILDQIRVVPNPYVISHQGQKSAYDAKLYFTRLPKECTIDIYTASGDLVTSLEWNENLNGRMRSKTDNSVIAGDGIAIYDLLTKNGQRVQSQTLVALIKTPCGAMTTKQFSVIVGGFRIID